MDDPLPYEPFLRDENGSALAVKISGVTFKTKTGYTVAVGDNAHNEYLHNGEGHTSPIVKRLRVWRGGWLFGYYEDVEELYYPLTQNGYTDLDTIKRRIRGQAGVGIAMLSPADERYTDRFDLDRNRSR